MSNSKEGYYSPGYEYPLDAEALREIDRDSQIEVMRTWFFENYEDPAESTPHDEGEYIYIWGGPYDARSELESEFGDIVADDAIDELANDLDNLSGEWAGKPSSERFDDFIAQDIATISTFLQNFRASLNNILSLLETQLSAEIESHLFRLLYANVITALETYLSDAFITRVINSENLMRRLVETTPEFKNEKLSVSEIYQTMEVIKEKVGKHLGEVVWHSLNRVKPMYKDTLGIEFPPDLKAIFRAILVRHDIVHRNGKDKDGKEHVIQEGEMRALVDEVKALVEHIEAELAKLNI